MQQLVAHQRDPIPSLGSVRSDIPPSLDRVFRKMVAKVPAARYRFMGDLLTDLEVKKKGFFLARLLDRVWPFR